MIGIYRKIINAKRAWDRKWNPVRYARSIGVNFGKNCRFSRVNFGSEPYLIRIGDNFFGIKTQFITHNGGIFLYNLSHNANMDIIEPITIGNNVFIGFDSVILPGVTIGDNVIIGARAVVSKDIPSNCVAVGIPAKPIKTLDEYWKSIEDKLLPTVKMNYQEKKQYLLRHFGFQKD